MIPIIFQLAFCGILYAVVTQVALRNLEGNLRTTAQAFVTTYERTHQLSAADLSADPLSKKMSVLVFNARGEMLHTQGQLTPAMIRQIQRALPVPGEITDRWLRSSATAEPTEYRFFAEVLPDPSQEILVVGSPRTDRQVVQYLLLGMGLAGPSILLLAAGCGYWLATRAMRPVRLMTQAAREIEETDLSRRLNLQSQDELGELASTFDQMLARLEAAFQRQRQFTADASHELRTPLSIITLAVNRGMTHCHTPEEYRQVLQTIHLENARMSRLVHDLLLLARADGEQGRLKNFSNLALLRSKIHMKSFLHQSITAKARAGALSTPAKR
jgi:signal transduction histidine kinase